MHLQSGDHEFQAFLQFLHSTSHVRTTTATVTVSCNIPCWAIAVPLTGVLVDGDWLADCSESSTKTKDASEAVRDTISLVRWWLVVNTATRWRSRLSDMGVYVSRLLLYWESVGIGLRKDVKGRSSSILLVTKHSSHRSA